MTTIAYKDGILAADTRGTDESYHPGIYKTTKLFRVDDAIIATAGDDATGMMFVDWYGKKKNGKRTKPPTTMILGVEAADFCVLVLRKDGLFWADKWCRLVKIEDDFYAIGSGGPYAIGAMEMGATAEEAVRVAMKRDPHTGGEVQTMKLGEEAKPGAV